MLLCMKTLGCNKLDGHRSPCEKRVVKITPELVTISYRKDGKDYLLSMPSEHAEWAEEMLSLDREAVERAAAEKALTDAADDLERANASPNLIELESRYAGFYSGIRSTTASNVEKLRTRAATYRREETE